jgi:hypothetical protein
VLDSLTDLRDATGYFKRAKDQWSKPPWLKRSGWHDVNGRMNGKGRTGGLWGVVVQGGKINAVVGRNTKTEPKQVKEVNLSSNGLDGYIPMSIGAIDSLEHLKLAYNPKLVGVIPETIGDLTHLMELHLSKTSLNSVIPESIGSMQQLKVFEAYECQLTGPVPSSIGRLKKLEIFRVQDNQLTGKLPAEIGGCKSLKVLCLSSNPLGGPLPKSIGGCSSLVSLYMESCNLDGIFPGSITRCLKLQHLFMRQNLELSGELPKALGDCKDLTHIMLSNTSISGCIPKSLENCTMLQSLHLLHSEIKGGIPQKVKELPLLSPKSVFVFSEFGDLQLKTNQQNIQKSVLTQSASGVCLIS